MYRFQQEQYFSVTMAFCYMCTVPTKAVPLSDDDVLWCVQVSAEAVPLSDHGILFMCTDDINSSGPLPFNVDYGVCDVYKCQQKQNFSVTMAFCNMYTGANRSSTFK